MAKPLFVIGNKRSGTQRLVTLMCLHPEVFVSLESDVAWVLYQARNGRPIEFARYPWDECVGMTSTITNCAGTLEKLYAGELTIEQAFYEIQLFYMQRYRHTTDTRLPMWVGDKKPIQDCDPDINAFIEANIPEAKYIHIVRNPRATVLSMMLSTFTWREHPAHITPYWYNDQQFIFDRWVIHEQWALEVEKRKPYDVLRIKFEDLCSDPVGYMECLFAFLGLETPNEIKPTIESWVDNGLNEKYMGLDLPTLSDDAKRVMDLYGYEY